MIRLQAPAKINLSLEVTGKRPDGYHEIVSVTQTVTVFDSIEFRAGSDITVRCRDESIAENNLVEIAARLLSEPAAGQGSVITLDKRIPVGAGLGGGSSDAATTLLGLIQLWDLRLECDSVRVLAGRLGSDVPFFLYGGTCLVEGRGERVARLNDPARQWFLLVNPRLRVPTPAVFAELRPEEWSDGGKTREVAQHITSTRHTTLGRNSLQSALFRRFPEARRCFEHVSERAPAGALVSGSGPTVFAPFADRETAREASEALIALGYWTALAFGFSPKQGFSPCV